MATSNDKLVEDAGEYGNYLADGMGKAAVEAIEALPASTPKQRAAIARIVSGNLADWAEKEEAKA